MAPWTVNHFKLNKMKSILLFVLLFVCPALKSQVLADFENIDVPEDSYIKDAGPENGFFSGRIFIPNMYTDAGTFDFWNGWVVSNVRDTVTPGFMNEAASFAGGGFQSENYAVAYAPGPARILTSDNQSPLIIEGMYVCNSTYAALSMRDGDAFAKKFGGASGDDPDYLYMSIKKYLDGQLSEDSVQFYLADYRFDDNSLDYIVDAWTWLDLSPLGYCDSLEIRLYSSDVGAFGINTPSYFCVDNILTAMSSSVGTVSFGRQLPYPNPSDGLIYVPGMNGCPYRIVSGNADILMSGILIDDRIDISPLPKGLYLLQVLKNNEPQTFRITRF